MYVVRIELPPSQQTRAGFSPQLIQPHIYKTIPQQSASGCKPQTPARGSNTRLNTRRTVSTQVPGTRHTVSHRRGEGRGGEGARGEVPYLIADTRFLSSIRWFCSGPVSPEHASHGLAWFGRSQQVEPWGSQIPFRVTQTQEGARRGTAWMVSCLQPALACSGMEGSR